MVTRRRRPVVLSSVIVVVLAATAIGLYLFQPWRLLTDVTVDEAVPTPASIASPVASPEPSVRSSAAPAPSEPTRPTEPSVLAEGTFISHEHGTTGTAQVLELADGDRVLRLTGLDTSNGPDLKVWLTDAPVIDGPDGWFVFDDGAYVDLGSLKGNQGNQNYRIPADVDLADLTSVAIWCDRFNVSFGAAELTTV